VNLYADLLFTGGPIYTADAARPWTQAVAVRDGRILAMGREAELSELRGAKTEVVDLRGPPPLARRSRGRLLLPGFTDSHIHFIEVALRAVQIDATGAKSANAVAAMIRTRAEATPAGAWIVGGGWDANLWTDGIAPCRSVLDGAAPEHPVALDGKDLHSVWVNSSALRRAGITSATPDVVGGVIERDEWGEPTGILRENAVPLIRKSVPAPGLAETTVAVRAALVDAWAAGIVAIHNASDTLDGLALRTYQLLRERDELGLRVLQNIPAGSLGRARELGLRSGFGDARLRIGGIKFFADGSLGSRTAAMLQSYLGQSDNWGVLTADPEELLEQALLASGAGLSLAIHSIGDRANREVLNILAEVRRQEANPDLRPRPGLSLAPERRLRHRIEHVQCIHSSDLPRLAQLDVIASVQPIHATSDMQMVDDHWGPERAEGAYAFRSLLDSGAHLVFGSDGPVEPFAPLTGIHAAATRRRADGSPGAGGWRGQERVILAEAIDAYTCWPAHAAREESYRGSIAVGKVADLVLLSQNIFDVEPMEILNTRVDLTVLDGRIVWRRG
jgi:predicted amidohydrolase YtcJ